jgi:hypothetical protein
MDSDRRYVMAAGNLRAARGKPTLQQLGVDPAELDWQRSGSGAGSLEVAFVGGQALAGDGVPTGGGALVDGGGADWVLLRVADDPTGRVLVYDRTEWMCFLDGVGRGEFG